MKRLVLLLGIVLTSQCTALAQNSPSDWRMDSTWVWYWNTNTSDWQKIQRILRNVNGSGRLTSQTTISWNYQISEWVNLDRISNEYYPDHTTRSSHTTYAWNPTDLTWMEEYHGIYNTQSKTTEWESKNYDVAANAYTNGERGDISYSPAETQETLQTLIVPGMSWRNAERYTREYSGSGKILSSLAEVWDDMNLVWVNNDKVTISYDQQDQKTEELYRDWNPILGDWFNVMRFSYEYNSSGWNISISLDGWNSVMFQWDNYMKLINHYDEFGKLTQMETSEWDDATQSWKPDQKETYSYHSNDTLREKTRSIYIPSLYAYKEVEYTAWDDKGNETERINKDIDMTSFEYYQGYRNLTTYSDGLIESHLSQQLVVPANTWADVFRTTYTYDINRNNTLKLSEAFDEGTQQWRNSGREENFFSSYIGIEESTSLSSICVFQNPIQAGGSISCPGLDPSALYNFRLYTVQGKSVSNWSVKSGEPVVVPASLTEGIYLLRISGDNGYSVTGKVIVTK